LQEPCLFLRNEVGPVVCAQHGEANPGFFYCQHYVLQLQARINELQNLNQDLEFILLGKRKNESS